MGVFGIKSRHLAVNSVSEGGTDGEKCEIQDITKNHLEASVKNKIEMRYSLVCRGNRMAMYIEQTGILYLYTNA